MKFVAVINEKQPFFQEESKEDLFGDFLIKPNLIGELTSHHQPINHQHQHKHQHQYHDYESKHQHLKEKDDHFLKLQELIDQKKHFLLANQKKLKKISKQNEFLEHVKGDYFKYNDYIVKQKNDQMKALELLNEYIKELTNSGELSEQNVKDSRHEQRKILKEIKYIKGTLDELIDDNSFNNTTPSEKKI